MYIIITKVLAIALDFKSYLNSENLLLTTQYFWLQDKKKRVLN